MSTRYRELPPSPPPGPPPPAPWAAGPSTGPSHPGPGRRGRCGCRRGGGPTPEGIENGWQQGTLSLPTAFPVWVVMSDQACRVREHSEGVDAGPSARAAERRGAAWAPAVARTRPPAGGQRAWASAGHFLPPACSEAPRPKPPYPLRTVLLLKGVFF